MEGAAAEEVRRRRRSEKSRWVGDAAVPADRCASTSRVPGAESHAVRLTSESHFSQVPRLQLFITRVPSQRA